MSVNLNEPAIVPAEPAASSTPSAPTPTALHTKSGGDWNKANESYFNAVNELGRRNQLNDQLVGRTQQLEAALRAVTGGGGESASIDPLDALQSELGLPIEPFRKAIGSEVASVIQALFGPMVEQMQADETLAGEIDNFDALKGDARKYMKDNPEVADTFNAVKQSKPAAAWKYAIREMLIARNAGGTGVPRTTHAGLPGGATPQGRSPVNPAGPPQAQREGEALEYGKAYGDMAPYRHERFKGTSIERAVHAALRQSGREVPGEEPGRTW
jgi:hypothetical protein